MRLLATLLFCLTGWALAEDNVLLIQTGPQGFIVWHGEGTSQLDDDVVITLMAGATPEGGLPLATPLGPARAFAQPHGVVIRLEGAPQDAALLVDRDGCGHVQLWHSEGATRLSDAQLTEIVMAALPEGGPRLRLDGLYAKSFIGPLGVTVTLWPVPPGR